MSSVSGISQSQVMSQAMIEDATLLESHARVAVPRGGAPKVDFMENYGIKAAKALRSYDVHPDDLIVD